MTESPTRDVVERIRAAAERFHRSYRKAGADECWIWQGPKSRSGYGRFGVGRFGTTASRAMMIITNGEVPQELEVCHTCDNRLCVNPAHLWIGTPKDNAQDKAAKGRCVPVPGELNGQSKLSASDIGYIRNSSKRHIDLAHELGVDESRIRQIRKGEGWKHVTEGEP